MRAHCRSALHEIDVTCVPDASSHIPIPVIRKMMVIMMLMMMVVMMMLTMTTRMMITMMTMMMMVMTTMTKIS